MESQSYYQSSGEEVAQPGAGRGVKLPPPLWWMRIVVGVVLALFVALPVVMTADRASVVDSILRDDPSLGGAALEFAIAAILAYTWILHAIYIAATLWFTIIALRGRRWARIALTVTMLTATVGSLVSIAAGSEYYWAAIPTDILQVVIIIMLWLPKSSRVFFSVRGRAGATGRVGNGF